nr:glycosyltransferase [Ideonella oryzae]
MIEVPKRAFDAKVMLQSIRLARAVGRPMGRPRVLLDFEVELTRLLGLFDRDHYLSQVDATSLGGMTPLRHYVEQGDAAGLSPSPLLNVRHYDTHWPDRQGVNRLLHFGLCAHFAGFSPSPWFDAEYYLRSYPDVGRSAIDALVHFQRWGWREGRSPLPGLDMRRLLNGRPELRMLKGGVLSVFASGELAQMLHAGDARARPGSTARTAPAGPDLREAAVWTEVSPRTWATAPQVDVFIPVYGGLQETLACLHSVLTAPVSTPHRVVVINDAGPDPELNALLRSLAARDLFVLEQHRSNLGFVKTVNHGLRLCKGRDVVILNSDTVVYNDWLDRLLVHAREHPRLASVTPLSNNATICSYPETLADNRVGLELTHAEIDRLAGETNRGVHVEAPTGVGFCMYMRRAAIDEVGGLDERHFGRGYGEENDWCQRVLRKGWRNAIACDVYVRHVGSVSFKGEALQRTRDAMKTLARLHPNYQPDVARYIARDPAWTARARLDLARLVRQSEPRNVLLVSHNRGGGTERHLLEENERLMSAGWGVFELRPASQSGALALLHPGLFGLHNLAQVPLDAVDLLSEALRRLRIDEVHVHHLIDFPSGTAQLLIRLVQALGLRLRVAVHDYYLLCPRVNLVNQEGRFCGQPSEDDCLRCLSEDAELQALGPIRAWREHSRALLGAAHSVVAPSVDVARRLAHWGLCDKVEVLPHEELPPTRPMKHRDVPAGRPARVLVIGAINHVKGFEVLAGLAEVSSRRNLPLALGLLGYSSDDARLAALGVQLQGRYFDHELVQKIDGFEPDLILIPSIWPETYCYVLTAALASGRRVAVFDLGAQADRTRAHSAEHLVLPLDLADQPEALAHRLIQGRRHDPAAAAQPSSMASDHR